ncbi:MAG: glycyl-radical enzyme activating protein [Anaerolineae bacterium]|nr:glycyl-radical enzyme activating protein [Anaerolineae bacterium]
MDFNETNSLHGLITNVQRFSIHDGPGIRTTVFFKGCPLRCFWCHNPETWRKQLEVQVFPARCIGCGACLERCPQGAHTFEGEVRQFRRDRCRACGQCVETCYAEALVMAGRWWTVDELLDEVLRDRPFYDHSGGGVTLSGGEPLMQPEFSLEVLQRCKAEGLHTAIETAAFCRWEQIEALLPWLDLVMLDLKLFDDDAHQRATGVSNRRILENAARLAETGLALIVRTPVIPTVNDAPEAIGAIAAWIRSWPNLQSYELMPFHRLAESKYRSLDLDYQASKLEPPSKETMQALAQCARDQGLVNVKLG